MRFSKSLASRLRAAEAAAYALPALLLYIIFVELECNKINPLLLLFLFAIGAIAALEITKKIMKKRLFGRREKVKLISLYSEYYKSKNIPFELFEEIWITLSHLLKISPEQLRPEDVFGKELGPYQYIDDEIFEIDEYLLVLCKELRVENDFTKCSSIDDIMTTLASIVSSDRSRIEILRAVSARYRNRE